MSATKKKTAEERRRIAERYEAWLRNKPKVICAEHGISLGTLLHYVREIKERM